MAAQDAERGARVRWHWWSTASFKVVDGSIFAIASSEPYSKAHGGGRKARTAAGMSYYPVLARTACRRPASRLVVEKCAKMTEPAMSRKDGEFGILPSSPAFSTSLCAQRRAKVLITCYEWKLQCNEPNAKVVESAAFH